MIVFIYFVYCWRPHSLTSFICVRTLIAWVNSTTLCGALCCTHACMHNTPHGSPAVRCTRCILAVRRQRVLCLSMLSGLKLRPQSSHWTNGACSPPYRVLPPTPHTASWRCNRVCPIMDIQNIQNIQNMNYGNLIYNTIVFEYFENFRFFSSRNY